MEFVNNGHYFLMTSTCLLDSLHCGNSNVLRIISIDRDSIKMRAAPFWMIMVEKAEMVGEKGWCGDCLMTETIVKRYWLGYDAISLFSTMEWTVLLYRNTKRSRISSDMDGTSSGSTSL